MAQVRDFGARGDGKTDDTPAIEHALQKGDGVLSFSRGDYLITRPLQIALQRYGRLCIDGAGGTARLLMAGAGPALHLLGTHRRSALPSDVTAEVWQRERMPIVQSLEIVGQHAQADGIRLDGVMQPIVQQVLIRRCRHGIHLSNRARNVLVANCHLYDNTGIGLFLDRVNLHQINVVGNHISYCKQGGIRIAGSDVRNVQITGNDIEYNYDLQAETSADILFDCRAGIVREGALVGNTVQAKESPQGANVRFLGAKDHPNAVGLFTISGNHLSSQARVLDLHGCRAVVINGNSMYGGYRQAIWAEDCEHLALGTNSIEHNPDYQGHSTDQVVFRRCRHVAIQGLILQHLRTATERVTSSMELRDCQNVNLTGVQIVGARERGIALENCALVRIADSTIQGNAEDKTYRSAVSVEGRCRNVMVVNNFLGRGSEGEFRLPRECGLATGNVMI